MKYLKICMMLALAFAPAAGFAGGEDSGAPFAHNRAPLAPKAYAELPLGAIRAQGWLLAQGWAPGIAKAALLAVKLAAIGVLLYTAFWLALLLAFALVGAWVVRNDDGSYDEEHKPEWRYGPAGYGLDRKSVV